MSLISPWYWKQWFFHSFGERLFKNQSVITAQDECCPSGVCCPGGQCCHDFCHDSSDVCCSDEHAPGACMPTHPNCCRITSDYFFCCGGEFPHCCVEHEYVCPIYIYLDLLSNCSMLRKIPKPDIEQYCCVQHGYVC